MRLLHTGKYIVEEFLPKERVKYAILSHTWGKGEISLRDIESGAWRDRAAADKLIGVCHLAEQEGFEYVWMDTCCIDKSSSAELSEAINSMFQWYQRANVCYVYLDDVELVNPDMALHELTWMMDTAQCQAVSQSRWFTRGWTLQELLANRNVHFYDRNFEVIGQKSQLNRVLSHITRIAWEHLSPPLNASVAQIMSWAAGRQTARPEDRAYSLLGKYLTPTSEIQRVWANFPTGLLGVNMPLLYGEGEENAFYRLQLEILTRSDDESIFAWVDEDATPFSAPLARSPDAFLGSGQFIPMNPYLNPVDPKRPPYAMTNKGLRLEPLLTDFQYDEDKVEGSLENLELASFRADIGLMPLKCGVGKTSDCVCLLMRRISPSHYVRLGPVLCICKNSKMRQRCASIERKTIFIVQQGFIGHLPYKHM